MSADARRPSRRTPRATPGAYRDIQIKHHGRLILPGGTYVFRDLKLGPDVVLEVRGAVVLRAGWRLELDHHADVLLAAGLGPSDVRWESLDNNTSIGPQVRFVGTLVAPDGDVHVGHHADVTGKVLAERIRVGPSVVARAAGAGGWAPVETLVAYGVNSLNHYTSVGGVARAHDRSGNLVDDGVRRLTWDYRNRLVTVADKPAAGRSPPTRTTAATGGRARPPTPPPAASTGSPAPSGTAGTSSRSRARPAPPRPRT